MSSFLRFLPLALLMFPVLGALTGCASSNRPLATVDSLDVERFMGDWYVIGLIPNRIEKDAYNSVESYSLLDNGKIDVTFTFREGSFDGPEEKLAMVARVVDEETRAEWRVRPFWPLSLQYLVTDLADDYRYTVVGHPSRNYVWIMARHPFMAKDDWQGILDRLVAQGFDRSRIVEVPQQELGSRTDGR